MFMPMLAAGELLRWNSTMVKGSQASAHGVESSVPYGSFTRPTSVPDALQTLDSLYYYGPGNQTVLNISYRDEFDTQTSTFTSIQCNGVSKTAASADTYSGPGGLATNVWIWTGDVFGLAAVADAASVPVRITPP
jgi:hypothetical protein